MQTAGKNLRHFVIAVCYKYFLRLIAKSFDPVYQTVDIGMAADSRHLADLCAYMDSLTKKLHVLGTLEQCSSQRSDRLISYKKYRISWIP